MGVHRYCCLLLLVAFTAQAQGDSGTKQSPCEVRSSKNGVSKISDARFNELLTCRTLILEVVNVNRMVQSLPVSFDHKAQATKPYVSNQKIKPTRTMLLYQTFRSRGVVGWKVLFPDDSTFYLQASRKSNRIFELTRAGYKWTGGFDSYRETYCRRKRGCFVKDGLHEYTAPGMTVHSYLMRTTTDRGKTWIPISVPQPKSWRKSNKVQLMGKPYRWKWVKKKLLTYEQLRDREIARRSGR